MLLLTVATRKGEPRHRAVLALCAVAAAVAGCGGRGSGAGPATADTGATTASREVSGVLRTFDDRVGAAEANVDDEFAAGDLEALRSSYGSLRAAVVDLGSQLRTIALPPAARGDARSLLAAGAAEARALGELDGAPSVRDLDSLLARTEEGPDLDVRQAENRLRARLGLAPTFEGGGPPPPAPGALLYRATFSDPASGWATGETPDGDTATLGGGRYDLEPSPRVTGRAFVSDTVFGGPEDPAYRPDLVHLGDVSVEVEGRQTRPAGGYLGLRCRSDSGTGTSYAALIDVVGDWTITRSTGGALRKLVPNRLPSWDIRPRDAANRIRLDCRGREGGPTEISLYVNGHRVGTARDGSGLPPGAAAIEVDNNRGRCCITASFSGLTIRRLR